MSADWNGRPCLVTGGAGFGGSHLCEQLLGLGAKVYVLDRWLPASSYLTLTGLARRVEYIQGDIRDLGLMQLTLERFQIDTVFHLAAQPIVPASNVLPLETLSINVMGAASVLEAVRAVPAVRRMVFASSGAYYGTTTTDRPISEDAPALEATNIYAPSKAAADLVARCYARVFGIKTTVCRFMNTYGPGDTNFSRIIPRAIRNLIRQEPYEFGDRDDGSTRLDFLYIKDMASAYIRVAEGLDSVAGEAFNFGSGNPVSTRDLSRLVSKVYDGQGREPIFGGKPKAKPVIKSLDIRKARERLGWQPTTPLEQGLSETIAWYRRYWERL
jgi:CDP-glucose 4,6-dehydratase